MDIFDWIAVVFVVVCVGFAIYRIITRPTTPPPWL